MEGISHAKTLEGVMGPHVDVSGASVVAHHSLYLKGELPEVEPIRTSGVDALETLDASNLTYHYPGSGRGIEGASLNLQRGSITVITGRVASGKTTLLRVLLGLLPQDEGEIRWNGQMVADPATFFVPPRSAYTAQIPRLFSDTLQANILLGQPENAELLQAAVHTAVMEHDVELLEHSLITTVGARGVKLSGGQIQRAAAVRMFARQADLLVFDDLSSALDVATEQQLWERLLIRDDARQEVTCLLVSHRRSVLQRADSILVLKDGQVEASGRVDELLASSEEFRAIWQSEEQEG
jgi:ATP-binding cassette subfamily B protein